MAKKTKSTRSTKSTRATRATRAKTQKTRKTSRTPARRPASVAKKRSAKPAATAPKSKAKAKATATATVKAKPRDLERHVDGCDVDFLASEITPDSALPPARGGVEPPSHRSSPKGGRP